MDYFKTLPEEISLEILIRLPTQSVLDSKLVCTNWRKIISYHPSFSKTHFHHHLNHPSAESGKPGFVISTCRHNRLHYFEYDDQSTRPIQRITKINLTSPFKYFRFIGSCNGLICLLAQSLRHPSVYICNPITRECVILPEIKRDSDTDGYSYEKSCFDYEEISFGYVSSTNEYKIVGFCKLERQLEVHIYTLGSGNGWRNLGKFSCEYNLYLKYSVYFANGALYWLEDELEMIGTFDLAEEKFGGLLSPPPLPSESNWCDHLIGVLSGFLFFALHFQGNRIYDLWMLKKRNHIHDKEEGVKHWSLGWNNEFRINFMLSGELLAVTKNDGVLTLRDNNYFINIYDTTTSTSKSLVKLNSYILEGFPHKNTLVSLKELGEEDVKVMEPAKIEETESSEQVNVFTVWELLLSHLLSLASASIGRQKLVRWVWDIGGQGRLRASLATCYRG